MINPYGDDMPNGIDMFDLSGLLGKKPTQIYEHWGIKKEEFEKWVDDILCSFIRTKNIATVLSKFFPKLSAEDRVKIMAFVTAHDKFLTIVEPR